MGRLQFDMRDSAELLTAISNYHELAYSFTQLVGGKDSGPLREFWNRKIVQRETETWLKPSEYDAWRRFNIHMFTQMWGSTACGWGGMGGAAMTESYTIIIENELFGFACIYYGGRLAYICETDEKYMKYVEKGYRGMPGIASSSTQLTIIHKTR